jgi:uncharacterized membrane protein
MNKIPKIGRVPKYLAHLKRTINPIVRALNSPNGILVSSSTVTAKRLPDSRVVPAIAPGVSLGTGGAGVGGAGGPGGGGPYGGSVFVIG